MVPKAGYHSYTEDTGIEVSRTGQDQVELAGRADSRDGRNRRRAQPRDGSLVRSLPIFLSVNVLREIRE
ncbi:hypothetical protein DY000_02053231 [Brassica cretica]|uniref:Uncharacterized protein n=1 Tax=Brassica cretica TaxID=69181 RepID=A0ABQ7ADX3_BRACR|nr:hypothetical protein DY000_02053231 [Brassica cretica]